MTMPDTDPLAAELATMRPVIEAYEDYLSAVGNPLGTYSARLLAAVGAVLKPHQSGRYVILGSLCDHHEAHRQFSITSQEAAQIPACPDCTATVYASCADCGDHVRFDSCRVRAVITACLLGEDKTDAS